MDIVFICTNQLLLILFEVSSKLFLKGDKVSVLALIQ